MVAQLRYARVVYRGAVEDTQTVASGAVGGAGEFDLVRELELDLPPWNEKRNGNVKARSYIQSLELLKCCTLRPLADLFIPTLPRRLREAGNTTLMLCPFSHFQ